MISVVDALQQAEAAGMQTFPCFQANFTVDHLENTLEQLSRYVRGHILSKIVEHPLISAGAPLLAPSLTIHMTQNDLLDECRTFVLTFEVSDLEQCSEISLRKKIRERVLSNSASPTSSGSDCKCKMSVHANLSVGLLVGEKLHFVTVDPIAGRTYGCASLMETGGLRIEAAQSGSVTLAIDALVEIWNCCFHAVLLEKGDRILLFNIFLDENSEQQNTKELDRLIRNGLDTPENAVALLANCAPSAPSQPISGSICLAKGLSHGSRFCSGPLISELSDAPKFIAIGQAPILVTENLLPSEASGMEQLAGIVLGRAGPASHISVLGKSLGIGVIAQANCDLSGVWECAEIGDHVTICEATGSLYLGAIESGEPPSGRVAKWLLSNFGTQITLAVASPKKSLPSQKIGLCRSELQIVSSGSFKSFFDYLTDILAKANAVSVPSDVKSLLREALQQQLILSAGNVVNYRLVDADLDEILAENIQGSRALQSGIRGPKWALASDFYKWQIEMAIDVAKNLDGTIPINLILTVPSICSPTEVSLVRSLYDNHLKKHASIKEHIRFGIMLETPSICLKAKEIAKKIDVVCFGLNDLTSLTLGISRDDWNNVSDFYKAAEVYDNDPFLNLEKGAVGLLIRNTIIELRSHGFDGELFFCGEAACSAATLNLFLKDKLSFFSTTEAMWAQSVMSAHKTSMDDRLKLCYLPHSENTAQKLNLVIAARRANRRDFGQAHALNWFRSNCNLLFASPTDNWKVLKKHLVEAFFGRRESKFFYPPWNADEVVRHLRHLDTPGRAPRISAFSDDISCHSRSELAPIDDDDTELFAFVDTFNRGATLNVFPQQDPNQLCFRLAINASKTFIEAGWGQAMYVFENERGQHPVICLNVDVPGKPAHLGGPIPATLREAFEDFLLSQGAWIRSLALILPHLLGCKDLCIEGYYNPIGREISIVDIDLPLDVAWNI